MLIQMYFYPYDTQDFNRYSYARNNPLYYVDPSRYEIIELEEIVIYSDGDPSWYDYSWSDLHDWAYDVWNDSYANMGYRDIAYEAFTMTNIGATYDIASQWYDGQIGGFYAVGMLGAGALGGKVGGVVYRGAFSSFKEARGLYKG
ncbi:MAG: hypothetical protein HF962_05470 [Sulfurovum sp.]|nr:hypothetical protein [Sulfurovum sp.]